MDDLAKILAPFSLGRISDLIDIANRLEENGFNLTSLKRYYDQRLMEIQGRRQKVSSEAQALAAISRKNLPPCPDCGRPMMVMAVNTNKANQIGGTARSMWQCSDPMGCGYQQESDESIDDVRKRLIAPNEERIVVERRPDDPPPAPGRRRKSSLVRRTRAGCGGK